MSKIRNGFVSNSSSSSFIISTDAKNLKATISIEVDLYQFIDTDGIITTEEQLREFYKEHYWAFDEGENNIYGYKECLEEIKNGKTVYMLTVGSEDGSEIGALLYNQSEGSLNNMFKVNKHIHIIRSEC